MQPVSEPGRSQGSRRRRPTLRERVGTLIAALLAALGLAACGPPQEVARDVAVELRFDPPPRVGDTTCTVALAGPDGTPVAGATVEVEGNMNHAGMVPVFGEAAEAAPGIYETPFEFTMGGDWFVIVRAELSDGRTLEETLDVPAVPSGRERSPEADR